MNRIFRSFLLLALALSLHSCYNDCCYAPPIVDVYSYFGGQGTNFNRGAVEIVVNPDGYWSPNQFYDIELIGFGVYALNSGPNQRVVYTFLAPGSYRLLLWVYCYDPFSPNCFQDRYDIRVFVDPQRTTRVDFRP